MRNIYERNKSCRLIGYFHDFSAITTPYISGNESSIGNEAINKQAELSVNKKIATGRQNQAENIDQMMANAAAAPLRLALKLNPH